MNTDYTPSRSVTRNNTNNTQPAQGSLGLYSLQGRGFLNFEMADDTFWSAAPSAKRKRISAGGMFGGSTQGVDGKECSKIEDPRRKASGGIRVNCQTIEVTVGPEGAKESFYIHEDAICDRSSFFSSAMKPEWASLRPNPRVVDLPDDDPTAFALYQQYIYSRQLPILPDDLEEDSAQTEGYHTLAYAYVLAERLMDIEFKNSIASAYVLYARGTTPGKRAYPSNEEIRILYEGTADKSPIRRLLVDIWCCRGKHEWMDEDADLPKDFLVEVTRALLKARPSLENLSRPWKNEHMQYHEKSE